MPKSLEEFLAHTTQVGDCLRWSGCVNSDGYPRACYQGNYNTKVHRLIYSLTHPDEVIDGKVIRHTCDNIWCINPDHLLSGTPYDNCVDRDSRGRGLAAFNSDIIKEIRALWATNNYTQTALAKQFNTQQGSIRQIVLGMSYLWVE